MSERLVARILVDRLAISWRLGVDLVCEPGEVIALLGPNGAGKSTILRAIGGFVPVSPGRVPMGAGVSAGGPVEVPARIDLGARCWDDPAAEVFVPPEQRRCAMVHQDFRLFPHLNVRDNVAFGPRCRGRSGKEARSVADEWLAALAVADLADREPGGLSGGQAQRVAIARALAVEPEVLLMDEPTSALDAGARADTRRMLREVLGGFAGPALVVTHDPVDALALADRIVVVENGGVTQAGSGAEIAARPATGYVAELLGLTLLRGRARTGTGEGLIELDGGGELHSFAGVTGPVLVALRPESVAVHRARPDGSPRNVWPARVADIELTGSRVRVSCAGPPDVTADITPAALAELELAPGDSVWLSVKAAEVQVYSA